MIDMTLPEWAQLRPNLSRRQRIAAVSLLAFAVVSSIAMFALLFFLADHGQPSFLPWVGLFTLGFLPAWGALETYGLEDEEEPAPSVEVPRLRLVHDARDARRGDEVRRAG